MKSFTRFVLAIAILCFALPAFCQTESAAISGRITDPKGAILVGADVRVQNVLNGQEVATKTNSSGLYVVRALQPGTYRVEVHYSSGLKRAKEITVASTHLRAVIDDQTPQMD